MANTLADKQFSDPGMAGVFLDPKTGAGWREGQTYTRPALANTLQALASAGEAGAELFYNGSMGQQLVADLAEHGGIITTADMADYRFILPGSAAQYGV